MLRTAAATATFWTRAAVCLAVIPIVALSGRWPTLAAATVVIILMLPPRGQKRQVVHAFGVYGIPVAVACLALAVFTGHNNLALRLHEGALAGVRLLIVIASGLLFAAGTNPLEVPQALLRIGIPHRFGLAVMVGLRVLPLLQDRLQLIVACQRARGARLSWDLGGLRRIPSVAGSILIPALYATLETSLGLADTLYVRGYRPDRPITRGPEMPFREILRRDSPVILIAAALLVCRFAEASILGQSFGR
jgi:energy-coupling factor transporter transmembrane protein EcfT